MFFRRCKNLARDSASDLITLMKTVRKRFLKTLSSNDVFANHMVRRGKCYLKKSINGLDIKPSLSWLIIEIPCQSYIRERVYSKRTWITFNVYKRLGTCSTSIFGMDGSEKKTARILSVVFKVKKMLLTGWVVRTSDTSKYDLCVKRFYS